MSAESDSPARRRTERIATFAWLLGTLALFTLLVALWGIGQIKHAAIYTAIGALASAGLLSIYDARRRATAWSDIAKGSAFFAAPCMGGAPLLSDGTLRAVLLSGGVLFIFGPLVMSWWQSARA